MGWRLIVGLVEDGFDLAEELVRDDDGVTLGTLSRINPEDCIYAWVVHEDGAAGATSLGSFTTLASARQAVQDARIAGGAPGSAFPASWLPTAR